MRKSTYRLLQCLGQLVFWGAFLGVVMLGIIGLGL